MFLTSSEAWVLLYVMYWYWEMDYFVKAIADAAAAAALDVVVVIVAAVEGCQKEGAVVHRLYAML